MHDYAVSGWGQITGRGNNDILFLLHRIQNGSGSNQSPTQWIKGALFSGGKAVGNVKLTTSSSAGVENALSHTSILQYVFMAW
jgi:hypothetical protein